MHVLGEAGKQVAEVNSVQPGAAVLLEIGGPPERGQEVQEVVRAGLDRCRQHVRDEQNPEQFRAGPSAVQLLQTRF